MRRSVVPAVFVASFLIAVASTTRAADWIVHADGSGDAATIQSAIDLAAPGDRIVLGPGTYTGAGNRGVSLRGKALTITSSSGRDATIIDCENADRGFVFNTGESRATLLEEVTIVNGAASNGGGIYVSNFSHPRIRRCIVRNCSATMRGGGVYCGDLSDATVEYNLVEENTAQYGGGMADDQFCYAQFQFNTIRGNTATVSGGGIFSGNDTGESVFDGNTVENNTAARGGGIGTEGHFAVVSRNRILGNSAATGAGVYINYGLSTSEGNLVAGNHGVGVYVAVEAILENWTIAHNTSHGVVVNNARPTLRRCIIAFNGMDAIRCLVASGYKPVVECCAVFGNTGALCAHSIANLVTQNPLFCATTGALEYRLAANSPCVASMSPCGELIGAFPTGCEDVPVPQLLTCPPDTTVAQGEPYTMAMLSPVTITNPGQAPATFQYQLSSPGPAVLIDGGNPASLAGTTPVLAPGQSYWPPRPVLLAAATGTFAQTVTAHVVGPAIQADCAMLVTFVRPVPVAFSQVKAMLDGSDVLLSWSTHGAGPLAEIQVRRDESGRNAEIIAHLPPDAIGFRDTSARPGTNSYDLLMIADGEVVSTSAAVSVRVPGRALAIHSVSPNPFRVSTRIAFDVPADGTVQLEVFDVAGRRVRTLWSGAMPGGRHELTWSRENHGTLPTGVYFLRLSSEKIVNVKKVMVLK